MAIAPDAATTTTFTLNGRRVELDGADDLSLLDALRDRFGIISPKDGCQPLGQCGCCTVLIDGKPRLSCTIKASMVAGKEVTTLEGLPEEARSRIADAFVCSGGVQCGFCIPGIALRSHALVERNPRPTRDEIASDLRAHLCRCTGYAKIIDAVESLAKRRNVETSKHQDDSASGNGHGGVGERLGKYHGRECVLGEHRYIDDIVIPGMLHGAMRFSDHPRALVRRIDTSQAAALPGVLAVVTAKDVPGDRFVGLITPDWPVLIAEGEETRCVGDVLAAVAAVDEQTARQAAELIEINYEVRRAVTTPDDALKPDAPKIHPNGNLLSRAALSRGDVDAGFAASAHVVEGTWQTQAIEHMYLEPEASIAIPAPLVDGQVNTTSRWQDRVAEWANAVCGMRNVDEPPGSTRRFQKAEWTSNADGAGPSKIQNPNPQIANPPIPMGLHVLSQGQGIFDDRRQIAHVLGWPLERLHVELVSNGGAFGGKEDMSIQAQTALLAHATGRPVKTVLNRKESMRLHPKRHPIRLCLKVGADSEGRLTALRARIVGDKGAYASVGAKVLERAAGHAAGPYRVPAVDIEALAVYTNNPPCGAMRGFGANQAAFAIEGALDLLAEKVGIDGWEIRNRNILEVGDRFATGQRLTKPFGLRKTLEAVKDIYRGARYAGIACGIKNVGIGNGLPEWGKASLTVEPTGRITIRTGYTEMGQGLFTVLIQTAATETGLPAELFDCRTDTLHSLDCGQTTGSRGTVLGAFGVMKAAQKLKAELVAEASRKLGSRNSEVGTVSAEGGRRKADRAPSSEEASESVVGRPQPPIPNPKSPIQNPKHGQALLSALAGRVYEGQWECYKTDKFGADVPDPKTHLTYGFATQVVILDEQGRLKKVVAAHDVGRAINPTLLEGQIEGSVHMGLGYALTEEFVCEGGRLVTDDVKSCGVLRAHHMPEIEVILVEEPDPETPYGARGVGEIGLVPTAPAVAGALYSYDKVRRFTLPMKDSPAAKAILGPKKKS